MGGEEPNQEAFLEFTAAAQKPPGETADRLNSKLLLEQLCQKVDVSEENWKLLELVTVDGFNQKEAAKKLGLVISQSEVSKRLAETKRRLKEAAYNEGLSPFGSI